MAWRGELAALTPEGQERLVAASRAGVWRGTAEVCSLPTESLAGKRLLVGIAASVVLITFGFACLAGPWTRFGPTRQSFPWFLLFVPLASAAFLLVRDLPRFLRLRRSRLQPAIVATPFLVGRVGLDDEPIELHSAEDIVGADVRHRGSGERYSHSEVVLATRGGTFEFRTGSRVHADGFAAFLQHSAARRDRWREEGVLGQKAREYDWLGAAAGASAAAATPRREGSPWPRAGLAVALGAFLTLAAWGTNLLSNELGLWRAARRNDDERSYALYLSNAPFRWHRAEAEDRKDDAEFRAASGSVVTLRGYLGKGRARRHAVEAQEAIRAIYRKARDGFAPRTTDADPAAVAALRALLDRLCESESPVLKVEFTPPQPVNTGGLAESVRDTIGAIVVHSPDSSFTATKNQDREGRILYALNAAFRSVLSDGILVLERGRPGSGEPALRVSCLARPSGKVYSETSEYDQVQEALARAGGKPVAPKAPAEAFVGLEFEFDVVLAIPGEAGPCRLSTTARPAPLIEVKSRTGIEPQRVYDSMADSAFDDFASELARKFGVSSGPRVSDPR